MALSIQEPLVESSSKADQDSYSSFQGFSPHEKQRMKVFANVN